MDTRICKVKDENCDPLQSANESCQTILNPYLNESGQESAQHIFEHAYTDIIKSRGVPIEYFINTFNTEVDSDLLYGESPLAPFYGPIPIMSYVQMSDVNMSLQAFGYQIDDTLTASFSIKDFVQTMSGQNNYISPNTEIFDKLVVDQPHIKNNQRIEPKAGDLIRMSMLACNRPGDRGAPVFEITMVNDFDVNKMNPMLGSYVWQVQAKRFDYSFERGDPFDKRAPEESGNSQVYDNEKNGDPTHRKKDYVFDVDDKSKEIFESPHTSTYGDYY